MVQTDSAAKHTLAPQMVEAAVSRLGWISLICAAIIGFAVYLEGRLQPEVGELLKDPKLLSVLLFVLLAAFGINAVARYRLLSPLAILNLGLAFEIVVAAAISFSETAMPRTSDSPVLGASKVALWIGVVGLLIPNKPWIKFVTALACATSWPLAYVLSLYLYGYDPLSWNRLVIWIHLPYVMAFVNYGISRRMWHMENAVQKARELGSYELVSMIGTGGMGEVWRARHRMLARDAAIKVIRADLMLLQPGYESDITRRRFAQEAHAIASLQSPHTVYLYDFGISENGSFYYVMELLDGISLQALVDRFGPLPASRVIHVLRQVCDSLEEAHRRGLVHRDIKPNNLFVCMVGIEYDFLKVLDFGLVKNVSRTETLQLTAPGVTAGTPAYMAPEVALGEESIDGRTDIYGLGCVAYFLLTGSPVFNEKTATATTMAHVQKTPVPPSRRSEVPIPPQLESLVLRCLAKRPELRPQSALELSQLLAAITDVPEWTQESAERWWQTYLPVSCAYRTARQPWPAGTDWEQQHAQTI
ncbi:MAG: serine/threonine protein kinase [Bryobacterales bacterium]|nr:serine/threonine protein kinase [Bryobacterales bacterium]